VADFGDDDTLAMRAALVRTDRRRSGPGAVRRRRDGRHRRVPVQLGDRTLSWDPDGAGDAAAERIATFAVGAVITADDFVLI
jgi:hypothetical protein